MRERSGLKSHNIDVLAALLLLCAFAMCILSVLLMGTRTYRDLTARDAAVFEQTTEALYVSTKLAQAKGPAVVSAEDIGGTSCVRIEEDIEGELYVTRIYCCDGWIRELFTKASYEFSPQDGEKVSEAAGLTAKVTGDLLTVTIVTDKGSETVNYSLREGSL